MSSFLHVIVVSFNTCSKTLQCLRLILRYTDLPFHLWVVDNASTDGSVDMLLELAAQHQTRLTLTLLSENVGYTRAIASVYSNLPPHGHVCLINSDVYVGPGYANKLYKHLERHPDIAAVAPLGSGIGGWQDILKYHSPPTPADEFDEAKLVQVNHADLSWIRSVCLMRTTFFISRKRITHSTLATKATASFIVRIQKLFI